MKGVARHLERMECYTCHASWTPQCYGCHVKIDYSQKDKCPECDESRQAFDWVAAGRQHQEPRTRRRPRRSGLRHDHSRQGHRAAIVPALGRADAGRQRRRPRHAAGSRLPAVGHRSSAQDGKPILLEPHLPDRPGTGAQRRRRAAGDRHEPHAAAHDDQERPHLRVVPRLAKRRSGWASARTRPWDEQHIVDLETVDGKILPQQDQPQMEPVENLDHDWSQIVDEEGNQLATVGHHFQLSRAFNKEEQQHVSREGTCLACHQEIPHGVAGGELPAPRGRVHRPIAGDDRTTQRPVA